MTLVQLLNQNSFLFGAIGVLGGWLAWLIVRRVRGRGWLAWLAAVALALGLFFAMRTAAPSSFETAADVQRAVSAGEPTLVEFYSDF